MRSLHDIHGALVDLIPNPALRGLLNTRLFLRTGVNLRDPHPEHVLDPERIASICDALSEFGYAVAPCGDPREETGAT